MEVTGRLFIWAILAVSCRAQLNSTAAEGRPRCTASLGGANLGETHKALILNLNADENCTWTIERPENRSIRIIFSHIQLDPDSRCENESIKVFDGRSTSGPLLGEACSKNDFVPVFESSANSLTFQIVTDWTRVQRSVFIFYYFFSSGTTIPNCGGYLQTLEGSFSSPNYPRPHPELAYCVWHIQVEKGYKINLNFTELFLEMDEYCRFDFIAVYDGPSTTSGLLKQVCGRGTPTFESSSDAMTVVLSTDYANSYRGFFASYASTYVQEVNTHSLSCASDKMRVIISKSYLQSLNYHESNLQLNDPTCRPSVSNVVEFSIPLHECGTIKKIEDHTISYTNIITFTQSPESAVITRKRHLQIVVTCEMEYNSTVEILYITEDDVIQNQSVLGKYNTSMALYESGSFENLIQESPYYVDLNQTLFVQATLHTSDPSLVVFLDTCRASPTSDFASPTYDLISSGCSRDETCEVYPLFGHYGRFQFNAFKFLRHLSSVYLKCKILICDTSDHTSRCNQGCVSRRKRDIPSYKWKTDSVIGPIRLKRDRLVNGDSGLLPQTHEAEISKQPLSHLHLFSFMVLALNVVIVVTATVRHFLNRWKDHGYQKLQVY
uniref:CUB and zona pellucida-like domain-containing protein 1 n=1 Tax=Rattus norvegicus TaxID=10116 RepID=CUZD1_RAT|nr:RecName: Full=CUB and zona pellucida-like domain-containing protein 1; Short=CUB and ZP domain-containing protein 1; AltName: Full=Estrogen-regulated protein 1; AltName: Full=Uterus/ovary-specific protein 44; Flags: Precursor [Rattus norvegicus]AAB71895.1 uterus-ovary specific putative transmembrane protein [Rattus norvegicus]|eukprot:NP_446457.1 CUB and zona pellucida-like domain-containing protein 1 precursor [Rattus norvegicus]